MILSNSFTANINVSLGIIYSVMIVSLISDKLCEVLFCTEMTRKSRNGFVSIAHSAAALMCVFYETPAGRKESCPSNYISDHEQQMEQRGVGFQKELTRFLLIELKILRFSSKKLCQF